MSEMVLLGDVSLTAGQRRTIEKAWLSDGVDCRVWPEAEGWVYVESREDQEGAPRGDGHLLDGDGDYRFPGGGKIKLEDL